METSIATKNNVQVVRQAFDEFAKGNIQGVMDACTNDVVWASYDNPNVPYAGSFQGKNGVQQFFSKLSDSINYSNFEPREFISEGENVIVLGHHTGTVKKTGKTFDHDWCFSFKLRDGKAFRFFAFVDTRDQTEAFK